jgi:hypothetical protein
VTSLPVDCRGERGRKTRARANPRRAESAPGLCRRTARLGNHRAITRSPTRQDSKDRRERFSGSRATACWIRRGPWSGRHEADDGASRKAFAALPRTDNSASNVFPRRRMDPSSRTAYSAVASTFAPATLDRTTATPLPSSQRRRLRTVQLVWAC